MLVIAWAVWPGQGFTGEMRLRPHGREGIVVREAVAVATDAHVHAAPPEMLPFVDPESALRLPSAGRYDAVRLPFLVQVLPATPDGSLHIKVPGMLDIEEAGQRRTLGMEPGIEAEVGGRILTVGHTHPWAYLQDHAIGQPVALLNVRNAVAGVPAIEDTPPETVAIPAEQWTLNESTAFRLAFFEEEVAARDALPDRLAWVDGARWGIEDGGAMNWFEGLTVGTGIILENGTDFTLIDYGYVPGDSPALTVGVLSANGIEERSIAANSPEPGLVRFEAPACAPLAVLVHVVREDHAVLGAYRFAERIDTAMAGVGEWWVPEGSAFAVRYEGASRHAVLVDTTQTQRDALEFTWGDEARRIVVGEEQALGDAILRYREESAWEPERVGCKVELHTSTGTRLDSFKLQGTGDSHHVAGWEFTWIMAPQAAQGDYVIRVSQLPRRGVKLAAGISLVMIGAWGLATRKQHKRG